MNDFTVILIFILTTCAGAAFTVSYTRWKFPAGCIRNGIVISGGRNGAGVMRFACAAAAGGAVFSAVICVLALTLRPAEAEYPVLTAERTAFFWAVLAASVTDLLDRRIPNAIVFSAAAVRSVILAVIAIFGANEDLMNGELFARSGEPLECLVSFLIMTAAVTGAFFLSKGGIGAGDVKLISLTALCFGASGSLLLLFFAFLPAAAFGIVMLIAKKSGLKASLPLAPFICFGMSVLWILEVTSP